MANLLAALTTPVTQGTFTLQDDDGAAAKNDVASSSKSNPHKCVV